MFLLLSAMTSKVLWRSKIRPGFFNKTRRRFSNPFGDLAQAILHSNHKMRQRKLG